MIERNDSALSQEIAAMRKEIREVRSWVRLIGCICLLGVVVVLWPQIKAAHLIPVAGFIAFLFVAAGILGHILPKAPPSAANAEIGGNGQAPTGTDPE